MADSSLQDFWDQRYDADTIPWDAGRTPEALRLHLREFPPGSRVLVPGCGTGYELLTLIDSGCDALAIDFSPPAVERARRTAGRFADRIVLADFFTFDPGSPFDAMYERAFLCALPRKMWRDYAARSAALIRPGGVIAGFFFYDANPKGPPFGTSEDELRDLLEPAFERVQDEAVRESIPVFQGRERWQVWRRA